MNRGIQQLGPFRALTHAFSVTVEGDMPVDIADVLGGLADTNATPKTVYEFRFSGGRDDGVLFVDGEEYASGRTRVLLQMLISRLGMAIGESIDGLSIHANTVRIDDGVVLIAGPSGRGKSTLTARLLLEGASLVAEDISVPDAESLAVHTFHRPVGLSEASFEVLGIPIPPAAGEPCGCGGKVLATAAHLGATLAGPATPTVVVLVDREKDSLEPLSTAQALARILEAGVAPTPDPERDFDTLVRLLAGARCLSIGSADLGGAVDWIQQLATKPAPDPVATLVERHGDRIDIYASPEAVVVDGDQSHLLNRTAAAVWLLWNEGLDRETIAAELQADVAQVDAALDELAVLMETVD